jgi:hypothetical protein
MPVAYDWALRDWQIASQAADGYLGDHVAATFHLAHYPHGHSDMDAVYFQFGILIQASRVKARQDLLDAKTLSWGHALLPDKSQGA